jgi:hypothetical protein
MQLSKYPAIERENLAFIYFGLSSISGKGREYLKNTAQSLIAIQKRPGTPLPDSICREIMQNPTDEMLVYEANHQKEGYNKGNRNLDFFTLVIH